MFTGLVQFVFVAELDGTRIYLYANSDFLRLLSIGDSVAIDGVCLTVVEITDIYCMFELSEETLSIVNFTSKLNNQFMVNVELSLKYGDFLGGHIMSGHVSQTGKFLSLCSTSGDMWIDVFSHGINHCKHKGSIAINGVSLTIAEIHETKIRIALIPETLRRTNLSLLQNNESVNVEFDLQSSQLLTRDHSYFMRKAIEEGERGQNTAPPNPWVGCVVVNNNKIMSTGYHKRAGEPHAEVEALKNINKENCTLYVTLEPCCHYGRTPPCVEYLIKKKVAIVVIGVLDPDSKVSGKGIQKLREAGIQVLLIQDINSKVYEEVKFSLRYYLFQRAANRPFITAKIALSMDNCYRDENGISKWITNENCRKMSHQILRSKCQGIIVGGRTYQQDKPSLKVRYNLQCDIQPIQIVIDGDSLIPDSISPSSSNILIVTGYPEKWNNHKIIVCQKSKNDNRISLTNAMNQLNEMIHCVVEGGGTLHHSFFAERLVNELVIFRNPSKLFGDFASQFKLPPHINLSLIDITEIDDNIMERYSVSYNNNHLTLITEISQKNPDIIFSDIDYAINQFKQGNFVLVMDDEKRENEGDLIVAASKITETQMTELINQCTGIICAPMELSRAKVLNLPLMCSSNTDIHKTAFTISVDYKTTGTGVCTTDRLATVRSLAHESTLPNDLRKPGHIYPLIAHPGGLFKRQGHTEAAVTLCKLAEIYPRVAVISELQNKDGTMKKLKACYHYAQANNIPIITVQQLLEKITNIDPIPLLSECDIYSKIGQHSWKMLCFGNQKEPHKVFAYNYEQISSNDIEPIPLRIHSECFTGDVFMSKHCDCGDQLSLAMKYIVEHGRGIIMFPSNHEGRGIGIVQKVKAYQLQQQDQSLNTFDANQALGHDVDARTYEDMGIILKSYFHVHHIQLLTENTDKINALKDFNVETKPLRILENEINSNYLKAKSEYFEQKNQQQHTKKGEAPHISLTTNFENCNIVIVHAMWHQQYIDQINDEIEHHLQQTYNIKNIKRVAVPGSFEIPFQAAKIAQLPDVHGIICVGILIKGDTLHFENVSTAVSNGIMQAQLQTGIPIVNHILSCLNMQQVIDRVTGTKSTIEYVTKGLLKMIELNNLKK